MALRRELPEITEVEILPKRGSFANELTLFRYQVVLHVGNMCKPGPEKWLDWDADGLGLEAIQRSLLERGRDSLGIKNIPNRRLNPALQVMKSLAEADEKLTVSELRRNARNGDDRGMEPGILEEAGRALGYHVEVGWGRHGSEGRYEVVFWKQQPAGFAYDSPSEKPWREYANRPLFGKRLQTMGAQLKSHVAGNLPKYMVPSVVVLLENLPLTTNGKVDRKALPAPDPERLGSEGAFASPKSEVEKQLVGIWLDVLGVNRVGVNDDFFELGGHSLLATQVISRIQETFNVDLPLRNIFEKPTIAATAEIIEWVLKERKVAASGELLEEGAV